MDEYDDLCDHAYDDGWYDAMAKTYNPYRYHKDLDYADGVDDADYYLWKKHLAAKSYALWV